jgi:hypothetical protein
MAGNWLKLPMCGLWSMSRPYATKGEGGPDTGGKARPLAGGLLSFKSTRIHGRPKIHWTYRGVIIRTLEGVVKNWECFIKVFTEIVWKLVHLPGMI